MKREDKNWHIQERAVIQHTEWQLRIAILCPIVDSFCPWKEDTFNTHCGEELCAVPFIYS